MKSPVLDERTFDLLVAEARRRIPLYTQETWTDHNESDPGIALIELFAWLTETMLWEINQVPERGFESLLRLLDIHRRPAVAAEVDVIFSVSSSGGALLETIPRFTQLSADGGDAPLLFETDEPLDPVRFCVTEIRVYDAESGELYRPSDAKRFDGKGFAPFGARGSVGSALYLGFGEVARDTEASLPADHVGNPFPQRFTVWVARPQDMARNIGTPRRVGRAATPPQVRLVWEYRDAQKTETWTPLRIFQDSSRAFTREGYQTIEGPQLIEPTRLADGDQHRRFWLRCRIAAEASYSKHEVPLLSAVVVNTVRARQLATVHGELLAVGNALADQEFQLKRTPLEPKSLHVDSVASDGIRETWTAVDTLSAAGPEDRVFTLDPATGRGHFGDDINGRIPERGDQIVATTYRHGGGVRGNVKPGAINAIVSSIPGVTGVTNARAAVGGSDVQSKQDMKRQAPMLLRSHDRAVTAADYVQLTIGSGGVTAATAVPLCNPNFLGTIAPGALTLFVLPDVYYGTAHHPSPPPVPSEALLAQVSAALEERRTLASEVFVASPRFLAIGVTASVVLSPGRSAGEIERACVQALNLFLVPPLANPPGAASFGRDLHPSRLEGALEQVDGVAVARLEEIRVNGVVQEDRHELIRVDNHAMLWGTPEHRILIGTDADEISGQEPEGYPS